MNAKVPAVDTKPYARWFGGEGQNPTAHDL